MNILDAIKELTRMSTILTRDIEMCIKAFSTEDSQFWRRTIIRTTFALIEGNTFRMKQLVFTLNKTKLLSNAEIALLNEEAYDLNEKGEAYVQTKYINITRNIKFAFQVFARAFGSNYSLKVDDNGWDCFRKSLKVRDRLTHPKKIGDLDVTEQEVNDILIALQWYKLNFDQVLGMVETNIISELERRLAQQKLQDQS
jgi:hypothetical protein